MGSDPAGFSSQRDALLVAAGPGAAHTICEDSSQGPWAILHQPLLGGLPAGEPRLISRVDEQGLPLQPSVSPAAVLGTDGRLHVTWRERGGAGERVYVRSLPAGGSAWGPIKQLNTGYPTEFVGAPAIGAKPDGDIVVAWAQSDGVWDQVFLAETSGGAWVATRQLTGQGSEPFYDAWEIESQGHHEGLQLAVDQLGNVCLAMGFQVLPNQRRVRTLRYGPDLAGSRILLQDVDTEFSFGVNPKTSGPYRDESAGIRVAAWADPQDETRRLALVAWYDLTVIDGLGPYSMVLRSSAAVGDAAFLPEDCLGDAVIAPCPPAGGPPLAQTPAVLDVALAVGREGLVHAAYAWIEPPLTNLPVRVRATRFIPDFEQETGAWEPSSDQDISCDPARCDSCPRSDLFLTKGLLPAQPRIRLAADGSGQVLATWAQGRRDDQAYTYVAMAWSADDGSAWTPGRPLTFTDAGPQEAGQPGSAAASPTACLVAGDQALIAWDDRRNWTHPETGGAPDAHGAPDIYLAQVTLTDQCLPAPGGDS